MTSYVLFGLCVFAFLLVGVIGMVGAKDNGAELMKERRDRLEERKKSSATVTPLGAQPAADAVPERKAA